MSSIKKNYIYNIMYNILILIIPLITAPYLSRIMGTENLGIYSYTHSIAQYFGLFAILGLNNYGNRTIAKNRDDRKKLSKEFSSIYAFQVITSILIIITYCIYLLFIVEYKKITLFQLIYVISNLFDINWFFFGLEKFKLTVIRNTIIKIIFTILIFVFVKSTNDLGTYILIIGLSSFISQISLWFYLKKYIDYTKITLNDIKKHIKPNLVLFIPVLAISLYNIMDKIMLGLLSTTKSEVGFYENAEKIISIPVTLINALGTVMLPRISNLAVQGKTKKIHQYISKSMNYIIFISIPISLIMIVIGEKFSIIFYGSEFRKTGVLIELLSIIIIFKSWANVIRTQYLIPNEKDKIYIISVVLGAIINLIFNMLLIPKFYSIGACIGTILAEFIVMLYQIFKVRNEIEINSFIKRSIPFFIKGILMFIPVFLLSKLIKNSIFCIVLQIIIGVLLYSLMNYKFIKNEIYKHFNIKKISVHKI